MNFTDEQSNAIYTFDRHLIVTAGAGSGKTRVLVERFMALLGREDQPSLPSIVAITFTEKAAREMRDRVRGAIESRIRAAVEVQDEAALERWQSHQDALTRARIGTIHGLCTALLRANPAEAGIDPLFEVLDETEAALLRDDAIETALARLVSERHGASALLGAYDLAQVREALRAYLVLSKAQEIQRALPASPEDLLDQWRSMWQESAAVLMAQVREDVDLRAALDAFGPGDLPPIDKISDMWRIVHAHTPALLGDSPAAFLDAAGVLAGRINLQGGSPKAWGDKELFAESKEALKLIRERAKMLVDLLPPLSDDDAEAAEWVFHWAAAIQWAADIYQQMKQDRGVLDFDDLETCARDLLVHYPGAAARYADPVSGEFKYLLVDEFQDTNQAQRDIIYALAGVGRPGSDGRLFVVGDPKQSIYAFRGADVSVFDDVRADLVRRGGADLPLSMSFRTHHNLVATFNGVFERILAPGQGDSAYRVDGGSAAYEVTLGTPLRAFRPSDPTSAPDHDCPLTLILMQKPADKTIGADFDSETLRQCEAWAVASHLRRLVQDQSPVWDRSKNTYRPVGYGDMALLFQSMTHVPLYEDVFKAAGLPYVTVAGKGYYDRQEVWDVLNLLRALHNPADDLSLAAALRSPLFGFSDEALLALRVLSLPEEEPGTNRPHPLPPLQPSWRGDRVPDSPAAGGGADSARAQQAAPLQDQTSDADSPPFSAQRGKGAGGIGVNLGEESLWQALFAPDQTPLFPPDEAETRSFACRVLDRLVDLAGRTTVAELLVETLNLTGYLAALTGLADGARRRGNVEKLITVARTSGRVSLGAFLDYASELTIREVREGEAALEVEGAVTIMSVHASKGLEFPVVALADASWWHGNVREPVFGLDAGIGPVCKLPVTDPDEKRPTFAGDYVKQQAERRDLAERRRLLYVGATRAQDTLIVSGTLGRRGGGSSWLRQWLGALDVVENELTPSPEAQVISQAWGRCALVIPPLEALPDQFMARPALGWQTPPLEGINPILPPLLAAVPVDPLAPTRFLAATHISRLGRAVFDDPAASQDRLWQLALHDFPDPIRPLPARSGGAWEAGRLVGTIVHQALRAWLLPGNTPRATLIERLRTYAWENGLSDDDQITAIVNKAFELLDKFDHSEIRQRIERAERTRQMYRELPFMVRWGERTVSGRIDLVYHDGQRWHVLDYKTAQVGSHHRADAHARRYYLQVGIYARALEAATGQTPLTWLYYIHPARLVAVNQDQWRPVLAALGQA
ncbi:MAG: UvrD-helicase domain-containing protein [Chloroflexi bacterium]|nr:UvrD-helicase domain-containing protein [Chloroflexota bacterium]